MRWGGQLELWVVGMSGWVPPLNIKLNQLVILQIGGEDGIRTHGAEDRTTAFETGIENSDRHGRQSILSVVAGPALGGMADERSDGEKHRAALSKAKALAKALDSAIESS
jgi:hypothetical protein